MRTVPVMVAVSLMLAAPLAAQQPSAAARQHLRIPIEYYTLPNGLKVVLSPDTTSPTAVIAVYYNIGFRIEPSGPHRISHLFEHLMFQGSANLGKSGVHQAWSKERRRAERVDAVRFHQLLPGRSGSNAVETMLWAEADRMKRPGDRYREPQQSA